MRSLIAFFRGHPTTSSADKDAAKTRGAGPSPELSRDRDQSPAQVFPSSGFKLVPPSTKLEEETQSWYKAQNFYPATIGEVFHDRYQVVAKLGYGGASTTWLCRDLWLHRYVIVKIYAVGDNQTPREVAALEDVSSVLGESRDVRHVGKASTRTLRDKFYVSRPKSPRSRCVYMLQALDFLHRKANLLYGDIQEDNILFAVGDAPEWRAVEEAEEAAPSPRKGYKHHTIHSTGVLELPPPTIPVLCDFGEARFGRDEYGEHAMPDLFRAPEILLRGPVAGP
ncbi:kinase-like domain-containing protein [Staphylotrichum tortipilum]|uniref:non-specific serine/threonine protein kinase n=1 Tax=Staphylotrichum tortipilum TaxID=2831512 RepID=A0AAN6RTZ5_9PEZI|nr:kinase-like domain-containing protein [Staphylotrichum longicolle]